MLGMARRNQRRRPRPKPGALALTWVLGQQSRISGLEEGGGIGGHGNAVVLE